MDQITDPIDIFLKFIESVSIYIKKEIFQVFHQHYYIRQFNIAQINAQTAINLYTKINIKFHTLIHQQYKLVWIQNQLRIFVWSLLFYSHYRNIAINDFTEVDWTFFQQLFPQKQQMLLQYQSKILLKEHNKNKKWVYEQDKLFKSLVQKARNTLKWSSLGKCLYIQSNRKYVRTSKQCRERWLNHLDPSKVKKYWLLDQDFILIQFVKVQGKKWAGIAKKLGNKRNQHSIKNRFKSLITKQTKNQQQQLSEAEIINRVYDQLLNQKINKSSNQIIIEINENSILLESYYQEVNENSIFDRSGIFMYDESPINKATTKINQPICMEHLSTQNAEYKLFSVIRQGQNQNSYYKNVSKNQQMNYNFKQLCPQIDKKIRADLFLQDEAFYMINPFVEKK